MERYYVYTLFFSKDQRFYTGCSTNLKERLQTHARGEVKSTAPRGTFLLMHYEYFINKEDAMSREKFLKSGFGRGQLKQALKRTLSR